VSDPLAALDDWPVPNAAAAVVGPDGIVASHGPLERTFPLASVTKPLTALAVLVAVEEEAVSLDDPADEQVLPGATLRHLLAHASGCAAEQRERAHPPATRRIYSNAGFELAAEMVERATDLPFARYLAEALCAPLSMGATELAGSPASGGTSSVRDLARIVQELLSSTGLLSGPMRAELATVQFPGLRGVLPGYGGQDPNDWGLGVEIRGHKSPHWTGADNSARTFGHFGQSGTMLWVDPDANLGLVALTDRDFGDWAKTAWPALSDAVLGRFRSP
jgi:CubicO group peptidase (beta-lactamase class C family)